MIDLQKEDVVTLREASPILPGRPHVATIYRWGSRGLRGTKLEMIRVGGRLCTSRQALQRFVDRLTSGSDVQTESNSSTTKEVEQELKRLKL